MKGRVDATRLESLKSGFVVVSRTNSVNALNLLN